MKYSIYIIIILTLVNIIFIKTQKTDAIEKHIKNITEKISEIFPKKYPKIPREKIIKLYKSCYKTTIEKYTIYNEKTEETFIYSTDSSKFWPRESTFQVYPYLQLCKKDESINKKILGFIKYELSCILRNTYSSSFSKDNHNPANRLYELDSIIAPLYLVNEYYEHTNNIKVFDNQYIEALKKVVETINRNIGGIDNDKSGYSYSRSTSEPFETLHQGRGNPSKECGLIKCHFRNTDQITVLQYNIPNNVFLVTTFKKLFTIINTNLAQIIETNFKNNKEDISNILKSVQQLFDQIDDAILKKGIITDKKTKEKYFAFEVDGYGNKILLDVPIFPSLISLPFFKYCDNTDPLYINTRKRILSIHNNPYLITNYNKDDIIYGLTSSNKQRRYMWPLYNIIQGITSNDNKEIEDILQLILKISSDEHIHETVNIDNISKYEQNIYPIADSMFAVFIEKLINSK